MIPEERQMAKLTQTEIMDAPVMLEGWAQEGDAISRTFTLPSFPASLVFASAVGHLAERMDHHPDILIRYRKVTLTLSTHSVGGLTDKDVALAREINELARA
jgi:4a-hydroxytetrahydrobiopterin dehydratase